MPDEETSVVITAWPDEPAKVEHDFGDQPVPVRLGFEETPAHVRVSADGEPIQVDMGMRLSADSPVPVCITVCEPICARSHYQIAVTIFDRPVAEVTIRGETRFFACDEKRPEGGDVSIR